MPYDFGDIAEPVVKSSKYDFGDVAEPLDKSASPKVKEPPGFFSRVGEDLSKRGETAKDIYSQGVHGKLQPIETGYDIVGKTVGGGVGDVIGEAGKSVWDNAPRIIKAPLETIGNVVSIEANMSPEIQKGVKAAKSGVAVYQKWAKENSRAAQALEATGDFVGLFPPTEAAKAVAPVLKEGIQSAAPGLEKAGAALTKRAGEQALEAKNKYLHGLTTPEETLRVREANVGRTEEKGFLRQKEVTPTAREKEVVGEVGKIEGVSHRNSFQRNYNAIAKVNKAEAEGLMKTLEGKDIPVDSEEFGQKLQGAMTELSQHPYIVGDAEKSAQKVMDGMVAIAAKNPMTVSGLLKTRRDFDNWVERLKGEGIFTPKKDDPVTAAVHKIRQTLNDHIEDKVPDVHYKASLRKQSNLYRAMDNIEIKAAKEGKNSLSRAWKKAMDLVPGKNLLEKEGALGVGGGALALGSHFGVPLVIPAAVGGTGYGLYKAATSPTAKKILGSVLSKTGQAIGKEKPLLRLEYKPNIDFTVGKNTLPVKTNPLHNAVMDQTRERLKNLGLTTDILSVQDINTIRKLEQKYGQSEFSKFIIANKNEPLMGRVWEVPQTEYSQAVIDKLLNRNLERKLDRAQIAKLNAETAQAWNSHQVTTADMVLSRAEAAKELSKIKGKPQIGSLGEALIGAARNPVGDAVQGVQ